MNELRFQSIFESMRQGIQIIGFDWRYLYLNAAAEQYNHRPNSELLGQAYLAVWSEHDDTQVFTLLKRCLEQRIDCTLDHERSSPDGSKRWFELSLQPVPQGALMLSLDITERKRVAESLRLTNAELERAGRMKDEFLANMSHELRTPLNAILSFSENLLEAIHGPLNERQQESLHSIQVSSRHLLVLINDILDLSKVEAGRVEIQSEPILVAELCQASLLFVKELAIKRELRLDFQLDNPRAIIQADPRRLKQMLVNLLSNAVKFTPARGVVSLHVTTEGKAGAISFEVRDTGIGIASEDVSRLFEPFSQLDSSLNRHHEGAGLGLALVRRLVELHGGTITVASELGAGSCFTITLPYRPPELTEVPPKPKPERLPTAAPVSVAPLSEAAPKQAAQAGPDMTVPSGAVILLAEDNEANILALSAYLQSRGYQLVVARNGREALEQASEACPDLILMDIQMPELDGLEAIRQLRAQPGFVGTPIIALTALVMPNDRERCLEAGASEYLTKPLSLVRLVERIEHLLKPDAD